MAGPLLPPAMTRPSPGGGLTRISAESPIVSIYYCFRSTYSKLHYSYILRNILVNADVLSTPHIDEHCEPMLTTYESLSTDLQAALAVSPRLNPHIIYQPG